MRSGMVTICSHKLVICVGFLAFFLLASPSRAAANETENTCEDGEEQDEQEEPECCIPNLMKEEREGKVCVELPSDMSVAVALTLILSFTFLISLQCFMHHHHEDMREYAYTVISSTVSIFSAVLAFSSFEGVLKDLIIRPLHTSTGLGLSHAYLIVNFIHMIVWYTATQLTMAYVSCALKSDEWRREILEAAAEDADHEGDMDMMLNVEIDSTSYGIVLAHLTGFAAISFWTSLQTIQPFNESPLRTLVPIPVAVLTQLIFEKISDNWRNSYIAMDGNKDWFENMWDEKCQEAEDDIMGLTLSVMIVNSLRFFINESHGHECLPNSEQKEEGAKCEFERTMAEVVWLLLLGLVFVVVMFLTKWIFVRITEKQEAKVENGEPNSPRAPSSPREPNSPRDPSSPLAFGSARSLQKQKTVHTKIREELNRVSKHEYGELAQSGIAGGCGLDLVIERTEDVILIVWGMAFAWCIFHGTREFLVVINPHFLGQPQNATTLAVVLAFGVTYIGFAFIRILDKIAELPDKWTPHEVDDSIRTVISAMSIFIGFSWEQTFEESVNQLAERTRIYGGRHSPAVARVVLGSACIGVVFSAWKWFILPFVFRKGWRYGYIFSRKDLHDRCVELANHDPNFSFEHLQGVAQKLADKADEYKVRFLPVSENASPRSDDYKALPSDDVEAMRVENQELKLFTRVLEQQFEEERRNKVDAMHAKIRKMLEEETSSQVEKMRTELQDLKSHTKFLEQQLEERCVDVESMRTENVELQIHTRFLEEQLKEQRRSDVEALQTEIQEMKIRLADERRAVEESKVHRRFLERLLQEERAAREELEKQVAVHEIDLLYTSETDADGTESSPRELDEELQTDLKRLLGEQLKKPRGFKDSPLPAPQDRSVFAEPLVAPRGLPSGKSPPPGGLCADQLAVTGSLTSSRSQPQERFLFAEPMPSPRGFKTPSRSESPPHDLRAEQLAAPRRIASSLLQAPQASQSSLQASTPSHTDDESPVNRARKFWEAKSSPSGASDVSWSERKERRQRLQQMLTPSGSDPSLSTRL